MLKNFRTIILAVTSIFMMSVATTALAAGDSSFADYKYVLQISEMNPATQNLVLNNAANLLQAYPPGAVAVEIVAYGPGLRLLFANNVHAKRIDALSQSGVRFSACNNTLTNMTKKLGYKPKLNPDATVVPGGVVRIGDLERKGYVYIRP
jgi:intracellular sulfur oxidation DsrE/DsrF family protein